MLASVEILNIMPHLFKESKICMDYCLATFTIKFQEK